MNVTRSRKELDPSRRLRCKECRAPHIAVLTKLVEPDCIAEVIQYACDHKLRFRIVGRLLTPADFDAIERRHRLVSIDDLRARSA